MLRRRELCPDCLTAELRQVTIRCALCGFAIFPGEPVALYGGPKSSFRGTAGTAEHDGQYVGCLRCDCCPSGGFFAGHWDGQRVVPAFAGGGSAAAEAMRTGQTVVCGDVSDPEGTRQIDPDQDQDRKKT